MLASVLVMLGDGIALTTLKQIITPCVIDARKDVGMTGLKLLKGLIKVTYRSCAEEPYPPGGAEGWICPCGLLNVQEAGNAGWITYDCEELYQAKPGYMKARILRGVDCVVPRNAVWTEVLKDSSMGTGWAMRHPDGSLMSVLKPEAFMTWLEASDRSMETVYLIQHCW